MTDLLDDTAHHAPDPRAADLARHLRELVVAREARRRELARSGTGSAGHTFATSRSGADPELSELDDRLHRALADAEDQCGRRFDDAFQAIAALERRTTTRRTARRTSRAA